LLYTFIDFYVAKFNKKPSLALTTEIAEIISWNIFQMDGLRYVVPMTCHFENKTLPTQQVLFGEPPAKISKQDCEGCVFNRPLKHNGRYVQIMNWELNKPIKFVELSKF
jgi:hypothetical protein